MQEDLTADEVRQLMAGKHVPPRPKLMPCPDTLEIELPMPPLATQPNARSKTWHKKYRLMQKQKADAATVAAIVMRNMTPPRWTSATVHATFYRPNKNCRRADDDNLIGWLKASFDGLQEAGVMKNDAGLRHLPPTQLLGKVAGDVSRVVLTITAQIP
jgi:Holliday junction resolvase RusA-like endonuclease